MPIIRIIKPNDNTIVGIWKITETLDNLCKSVSLSSTSRELLKNRKSSIHKLQFLSVRAILIELGYADDNLSYQDNVPTLDDSKKISIITPIVVITLDYLINVKSCSFSFNKKL